MSLRSSRKKGMTLTNSSNMELFSREWHYWLQKSKSLLKRVIMSLECIVRFNKSEN